MKRVLHLLSWPIPESVGGTEVYVISLALALGRLGIESHIGFPDPNRAWEVNEHRAIRCHRYRPVTDEVSTAAFVRWIQSVSPDVVNIHSVSGELGESEFDAVRASGRPVVFTVHVPSVTCRRGTLLRYGREVCDGVVERSKCAACYLARQGLSPRLAQLAVRVPTVLRRRLATLAPARAKTALRFPELQDEWWVTHSRLLINSDRVVAVCQWLFDVLARNGVPTERLRLSRQATDVPATLPIRACRETNTLLRIGYLGRLDPLKGIDIVVRAVVGLPSDMRVKLAIHGSSTDDSVGRKFVASLKESARRDPRIAFRQSIRREDLSQFFAEIDALAVPSTCLETGPLVVYEALAHRVPVLGSRLGGIAELVRDGVDGYLLPYGDVAAWRDRIGEIAGGRISLPQQAWPSPSVRGWNDAAREIATVYHEVTRSPQGLT